MPKETETDLGRVQEAQVVTRLASSARLGSLLLHFLFPAVRAQLGGGHDGEVVKGVEEVEGDGGHTALTDVLHVEQAAGVLPFSVHVVLDRQRGQGWLVVGVLRLVNLFGHYEGEGKRRERGGWREGGREGERKGETETATKRQTDTQRDRGDLIFILNFRAQRF